MTKLTTERLEHYAALATKPAERKAIFMYEVRRMARQILAYEQAAEKPYGYLEPCDFPRTTATVYPEKDKYAFMPLYAAPVLPKQPVVLYMGRELISKEGLELIRDGVSEATKLEGACMASTILGGNHHAQPVSEPYKSAANDIIAERQRQISEEGWTPEHDDKYNDFQLALAAAGYAQNVADYAGEYCQPHSSINWTDSPEPEAWPWSPVWWKPTNPRRDLVKAGALILAEIERLDRAATAQEQK